MHRRLPLLLLLASGAALPGAAQQQSAPTPPAPASGQMKPPPFRLSDEDRALLSQKKQALAERLQRLPRAESADAAVFLHVAEMADRLNLYGNKGHVTAVLRGLELGLDRCGYLEKGQRPWLHQPGKTLRGFISRIDGSIQPYGVVLPEGYAEKSGQPWRVDVVLHGRGPTEVTFLQQCQPDPNSKNAQPPRQDFVELHPFGRANNGWRWAGETDVFEAWDAFSKNHRVDPDRVLLRGFSMGGHGAWHFGVHYPHRWGIVSPGAGFSETREYLKIRQPLPAYQEAAWRIYDAVDYAQNLFNTPFITYGGEKDPQLQASLKMKEAAAREGLELEVLVGPNTEHKYHPDSLAEIMRRFSTARRNPAPPEVRFTTWTLKYNSCAWVTIDGLGEHYRRADVRARAEGEPAIVTTSNVTALTLGPIPGAALRVAVDGQSLTIPGNRILRLERIGRVWKPLPRGDRKDALRKRHGLQGPIDDAFMERFLVVRGTGPAWSQHAQEYAGRELQRFEKEWLLGFRGEITVKDDREVRPEDWADANLVLFGDPGSNRLLAQVVQKLPIRWTRDGVEIAGRKYGADTVPVLVYPNPLNPKRYVVINSGHTFAEKDIQGSNANLTPKLPDWAIIQPGSTREVLAAGFFDEFWRVKSAP